MRRCTCFEGRYDGTAHLHVKTADYSCPQEASCASEKSALEQTESVGGPSVKERKRRLTGFSLVSNNGECLLLQRMTIGGAQATFLTGVYAYLHHSPCH
jgi:hypothetical protein